MEEKFKKGNLVRLRTNNEKMIVIEYEVNYVGNVMNYFSREKKYKESVITSRVLCEWMHKGKNVRDYFEELSLELLSSTN